MTPDEIAKLPGGELAADEVSRIMEAWGFTYKSVFVWVKPSPDHGNYW